jgi:hypothetical protein
MAEQESPFASFVPSGEPPVEPPKAGKKKGKDKSTRPKVTAEKHPTEVVAGKKVRKARKPRQSRVYKIGIGAAIIALAGLSETDIVLLQTAATPLVDAPKKQRARVVVALAKIFA